MYIKFTDYIEENKRDPQTDYGKNDAGNDLPVVHLVGLDKIHGRLEKVSSCENGENCKNADKKKPGSCLARLLYFHFLTRFHQVE